jgi:hypothetical protein
MGTTHFSEVDSTSGYKVNGTTVINSSGSVVAPISQTGSNTLGDGAGDVQTLNGKVILGTITTISGAGAIPLTGAICEITTTGANALTLGAGTPGQIIRLTMVADGGDGTLTPSSLAGGTTITFNDVGDGVTLLYSSGKWRIDGQYGVTVA